MRNDRTYVISAVVKSDNHSNHGLRMGATVTKVDAPEWCDPDDPADWYSQGIVGDEVAIDPRDLRF